MFRYTEDAVAFHAGILSVGEQLSVVRAARDGVIRRLVAEPMISELVAGEVSRASPSYVSVSQTGMGSDINIQWGLGSLKVVPHVKVYQSLRTTDYEVHRLQRLACVAAGGVCP